MKLLRLALAGLLAFASAGSPAAEWAIEGDRIASSLTGRRGDPVAGRALLTDRRASACVLCHVVPGAAEAEMGNLGPSLAGVGARLSAAQLRLRLVDPTRVRAEVAMPAFFRKDLNDVAAAYRGQSLLTAEQIEDAVAWLETLK